MRIPPADLDHRETGVSPVVIDDWTSFGFHAALIIRSCDLMLHHGQLPRDHGRHDRRRHGPAVAGKFTGGTMAKMACPEFNEVRHRRPHCSRLLTGPSPALFHREPRGCRGRHDRGSPEHAARARPHHAGRRATRWAEPSHHRRLALAGIASGALIRVIRSSLQAPSTLKWAVAPSSKASTML